MNFATFTLLICSGLTFLVADPLRVKTTGGWVQGTYGGVTPKNKTIHAWRGIPFAEPPIGNLRFEPPVPKAKWSGILDVSQRKSECIQGTDPVIGNEDCLYAKIYSTKPPSIWSKLPVLVWMHGGAWWEGKADFQEHSVDLMLDEDVIVATFHYRLGPFGFLSTGDSITPGNNGIRDQILALKWIRENIRSFGGDPNRITIFGQSAGAASIGYLLQTPKTEGLFNAAIMQSGSPLCLWSKAHTAAQVTQKVGKNLKIKSTSSSDLIEKLKSIDSIILQIAAMKARNWELLTSNPRDGLVFVPVIEPDHKDAIISKNSHELLTNGSFHHLPIMIGFTSQELNFKNLPFYVRAMLVKYDTNVSLLSPKSLNANALKKRKAGLTIRRRYFGISPVTISDKKTGKFLSDDQFMRPITKSVELYSARTTVYFYQFSYLGLLSGNTDSERSGVEHTEDVAYLFDIGIPGSEKDYLTRNRMVRMWTNFAKTYNPTPKNDPLLNNIKWPANKGNSNLKCLNIDENLEVIDSPNQNNDDFWNDLFGEFGTPPYDTY